MHRDLIHRGYWHEPHPVILVNEIKAFDTVMVEPHRHIGIVEQVTNNLYHVVFQDEFKNTIHEVYTKKQLQKVFVVIPHSHLE